MNYTEFIGFRVTPEQREKLDYMAAQLNIGVSDVIRRLIDGVKTVTPAEFEYYFGANNENSGEGGQQSEAAG